MFMHTIRSRLVAPLMGSFMLLLSQVAVAQAVAIIDDPADGTTLVAPASVKISAEVLDVIDIKEATLRHNGQIVSRWYTLGLHYYTASNLAVGDHMFTVTATDAKGREYASNSVTVHVVATEPGPPPPPPPPPPQPLSLLLTRHYVYDANQQLCKVIEPESGVTVYDYDSAGNLSWSASGLSLTDPGNCNRGEAYASGRVVLRAYNKRNQLTDLSFPDGVGDQEWLYTPDGLPRQVTTINGADGYRETVTNTYEYNKRRLLTHEERELAGGISDISYGYSGNGDLSMLTYPSGLAVDYAPNALGQPTRAGSYATAVQYHANGAIASFTYGNGVTHRMSQNARQLPARSTDSGGVLDHSYTYDANANVVGIDDNARGANYSRAMQYDGLDRLIQASSPNFGGDGIWHYAYDDLDNLRSAKLSGVQDHVYLYDAANRLTNVKTTAGSTIIGLGYDAQGNLAQKNGQQFQFDYGNRLRASGTNSFSWETRYWYDTHGRRVWLGSDGGDPRWDGTNSHYSQTGQLLTRTQMRDGLPATVDYVYLGGSLVATVEPDPANPWGGAVEKFQHTDALGSPVAVTSKGSCAVVDFHGNCISGSSASSVIERVDYQPYGTPIGKTIDGVGYTGHVMDGSSGLTYMQQRYYDPQCGCFISVDPVTAYSSGDMRFFNRHVYAFNNPYRFTDPDGRATCADKGCETSTIDSTLVTPALLPPAVNGNEGLSSKEASLREAGIATVTFQNDNPNGASPNQPLATRTANMVEGAISKSGVQSVNINSTTGGVHGARSAHYSGRAVDINRVNGQRVSSANTAAARIQEAARQGGSARENFGPAIMEKTLIPGGSPGPVTNQSLIDAHQNHLHLSGQL